MVSRSGRHRPRIIVAPAAAPDPGTAGHDGAEVATATTGGLFYGSVVQ